MNFSGSRDNCLNCPASARIISSFSMIPIVKMSDKLLKLKFNSKSASESDSLALVGHSINEVNIKRRELIKPDLNDQFKQLCGSHTTVTKQLFGYGLP